MVTSGATHPRECHHLIGSMLCHNVISVNLQPISLIGLFWVQEITFYYITQLYYLFLDFDCALRVTINSSANSKYCWHIIKVIQINVLEVMLCLRAVENQISSYCSLYLHEKLERNNLAFLIEHTAIIRVHFINPIQYPGVLVKCDLCSLVLWWNFVFFLNCLKGRKYCQLYMWHLIVFCAKCHLKFLERNPWLWSTSATGILQFSFTAFTGNFELEMKSAEHSPSLEGDVILYMFWLMWAEWILCTNTGD